MITIKETKIIENCFIRKAVLKLKIWIIYSVNQSLERWHSIVTNLSEYLFAAKEKFFQWIIIFCAKLIKEWKVFFDFYSEPKIFRNLIFEAKLKPKSSFIFEFKAIKGEEKSLLSLSRSETSNRSSTDRIQAIRALALLLSPLSLERCLWL